MGLCASEPSLWGAFYWRFMKQIVLSSGEISIVDDDVFDGLSRWKWSLSGHGYAARTSWSAGKATTVYMHREIAGTPKGFFTDHIDGNKLNNRRGNLRIVSPSQNQANRSSIAGKSTAKGVKVRGRAFASSIRVQGKDIWLGTYETEDEAAYVYDQAAMQIFGECARLNILTMVR